MQYGNIGSQPVIKQLQTAQASQLSTELFKNKMLLLAHDM